MKVRNAGNQPAYNVFFGGADEARASPRGAYAGAHARACAQLTCEEKVTREEEELLGDAFPKSETIIRRVCVFLGASVRNRTVVRRSESVCATYGVGLAIVVTMCPLPPLPCAQVVRSPTLPQVHASDRMSLSHWLLRTRTTIPFHV